MKKGSGGDQRTEAWRPKGKHLCDKPVWANDKPVTKERSAFLALRSIYIFEISYSDIFLEIYEFILPNVSRLDYHPKNPF